MGVDGGATAAQAVIFASPDVQTDPSPKENCKEGFKSFTRSCCMQSRFSPGNGERPDGGHISCNELVSFLAPCGSPAAVQVAKDLDIKVETLLTAAANER
jgi:hypothetical protein